jgi:molybdopterin converting factor small subunit
MEKEKLITIQLQLYAWIASSIGEEDRAGQIIEKKIWSGATLAEFLTDLAKKHTGFGEFVFDPETGSMNDEVVIILNNKMIQYSQVKDTVLKDQDTITFSPVLVGG